MIGAPTVLAQRIACFGSPTVSVFLKGVRRTCNGPPPRAVNSAAWQEPQRRSLRAPRALLRGAHNAALLRPRPVAARPAINPKGYGAQQGERGGPRAPRRVRECVVCFVNRRRVCVQVLLLRVLDSRLANGSM